MEIQQFVIIEKSSVWTWLKNRAWFLRACKKTPRNQNKSLVTSSSSKTRNCSQMGFHTDSGVWGRSEFPSDYSLQLGIVTCLYASMEKYIFAIWPAWHIVACLAHATPLSCPALLLITCPAYHMWLVPVTVHFQSINFLTLWMKLAVAWDLSLPHFFYPILLGPSAFRAVNILEHSHFFVFKSQI